MSGCDCDCYDGDHASSCAIYVQPSPRRSRRDIVAGADERRNQPAVDDDLDELRSRMRPSALDVQHVIDHVVKALTLIDRHDDGMQGLGSFKTQITLVTPTSYRARVIDAHPGRSGRPEYGEPRYYDVTINVAPAGSDQERQP